MLQLKEEQSPEQMSSRIPSCADRVFTLTRVPANSLTSAPNLHAALILSNSCRQLQKHGQLSPDRQHDLSVHKLFCCRT